MSCPAEEFCPTYYKHGTDRCDQMLAAGLCPILKAKLYKEEE